MNKKSLPTNEQIDEMVATFDQLAEDAKLITNMPIWTFYLQLDQSLHTLVYHPDVVAKRLVKKIQDNKADSLRFLAKSTILFFEVTKPKEVSKAKESKKITDDWGIQEFIILLDQDLYSLHQVDEMETADDAALLARLESLRCDLNYDMTPDEFLPCQMEVLAMRMDDNESVASWATRAALKMAGII